MRVLGRTFERLEVVARGDVRRAKLYYLRGRVGKRARVAERRWGIEDELVIAEQDEESAVDSEGVAQEEAEIEVVDEEPEGDESDGDGVEAEEQPAAADEPEEDSGDA